MSNRWTRCLLLGIATGGVYSVLVLILMLLIGAHESGEPPPPVPYAALVAMTYFIDFPLGVPLWFRGAPPLFYLSGPFNGLVLGFIACAVVTRKR